MKSVAIKPSTLSVVTHYSLSNIQNIAMLPILLNVIIVGGIMPTLVVFSVIMLKVIIQSDIMSTFVMLTMVMLSVTINQIILSVIKHNAEGQYDRRHYANYYYADHHYAECHNLFHYAECHYPR